MHGWQLDNSFLSNSAASGSFMQKQQARDGGDDSDADSDKEDLPFACLICRKPFAPDPVVTLCGHYFDSACAIKRFAKNSKCFACGSATNGVFNRSVLSLFRPFHQSTDKSLSLSTAPRSSSLSRRSERSSTRRRRRRKEMREVTTEASRSRDWRKGEKSTFNPVGGDDRQSRRRKRRKMTSRRRLANDPSSRFSSIPPPISFFPFS
jgi:hypothetical protein